MYFNQKGDISALYGGSLKSADKFRSSVSYTENYINKRQAKAWTAIDLLSITWKIYLIK